MIGAVFAPRFSRQRNKRDEAKARPASSRVLPPEDARVADESDERKRRADAGDAHAACRLAVCLIGCRSIAAYSSFLDRTQRNELHQDSDGNLKQANRLAGAHERWLAASARCKGIGTEKIAPASDYLRDAAHAGVPEAQVRYAFGQGFGSEQSLAAMQDRRFEEWRRDAPGMMLRALEQGQAAAASALNDAYLTDDYMFAAPVPDDPVRARTCNPLSRRLRGHSWEKNTDVSAEQIQRGDADSDWLVRSAFGGAIRRNVAGNALSPRPSLSSEPRTPTCG